MKHYKPLLEIIGTDDEPNILEKMVDENFKSYKIRLLKKKADPDAIAIDGFDDALIGVSVDGRLVYDKDIMVKMVQEERPHYDPNEVELWLNQYVFVSHKDKKERNKPLFISLNMELVLLTLK
jgi:hypothetical protein